MAGIRARRWLRGTGRGLPTSVIGLIFGVGCTTSVVRSPAQVQAGPLPSTGSIQLVISVDWEGGMDLGAKGAIQRELDIEDRGLPTERVSNLREFRDAIPEMPLLHFLNPAYFTRKGVDESKIKGQIDSLLRPGDQIGLHVHAWKSLIEASGVRYRSEVSYYDGETTGTETDPLGGEHLEENCPIDCGRSMLLGRYKISELRSILRFSVNKLKELGWPRPVIFRSPAWLFNKNIYRALVAEGFQADSSAYAPESIKNVVADFAAPTLYAQIKYAGLIVRPDQYSDILHGPYSASSTRILDVSGADLAPRTAPNDTTDAWKSDEAWKALAPLSPADFSRRHLKVLVINGGAADYYVKGEPGTSQVSARYDPNGAADPRSVDDMVSAFRTVAKQYQASPNQVHYLVYIVHFETPRKALTRMRQAITEIFKQAKAADLPVEFAPLPLSF